MMLLHWKAILAGEVTWILSSDMPLMKNLMTPCVSEGKKGQPFHQQLPAHLLYDLI